MEKKNLNINSSIEEKKYAIDAVSEFISDVLFDKANFVTLVFSRFSASGGTTSTANYATDSRIIDTSEGKFFKQEQPSRMSCSFYTQNADKLEGYILSPALLDSVSLGTVSDLSSFRAYVGIKIVSGNLSVVVKNDGSSETLYSTGIRILGGFSSTYRLEIRYNLNSADVILNEVLIGTYELSWALNEKSTVTFYPLFSPGKTLDGSTTVDIVIENFQFLQDKN